jgi:hypothetical protein
MYHPSMLIGGEAVRPLRERRVYPSPSTGLPTTEIILGNQADVDGS